MKKIISHLTLAVFFLFNLPFTVYAGASATQSYKISVTIPAVVGLNVFPEDQTVQKFAGNTKQDVIKEEVTREGHSVVLETIVLK